MLGVGTCVASSGPWQPRRFQFHTVVLKKKSPGFPNLLFPGWTSRFLNMTLNWAWLWDPPTYSNRSLLKHEKIKHHHHFCRGWPYWFHSPFAWTQPICLCRDHGWLLDSFIGEETGSEGGDAFTKWPHHWFQKSWNLGEEHLCAFQKSTNWIYKHLKLWHWEVNTRLTVGLTSAEESKGLIILPQQQHRVLLTHTRFFLMGVLTKHEYSDSLFTAAKTGSISSRYHDECRGLWIQNAHHGHSSGFSFLNDKMTNPFPKVFKYWCDQAGKGLRLRRWAGITATITLSAPVFWSLNMHT